MLKLQYGSQQTLSLPACRDALAEPTKLKLDTEPVILPETLLSALGVLMLDILDIYLGGWSFRSSAGSQLTWAVSGNREDQGQRSMTLIRHARVYQRIRVGPDAAGLTT